MSSLSPTVQAILNKFSEDPVGGRNLYRARRIAAVTRQLRDCARRKDFTVRSLAEAMGTSASQAQRMLSMSAPANLTLDSVFRAADALGVEVDFNLRDRDAGAYYVQRSDFPVFREFTCWSTPPVREETEVNDCVDMTPLYAACGV